MVLTHNGRRWVAAVYFPRGQKAFSDIKKKFIHDCKEPDFGSKKIEEYRSINDILQAEQELKV